MLFYQRRRTFHRAFTWRNAYARSLGHAGCMTTPADRDTDRRRRRGRPRGDADADRDRAIRTTGGLSELLRNRPELRGVHAPADLAYEAIRWTA